MAHPAVDALDDARETTVDLLLPFDLGRWARLAVLAFFVGGAGGVPTGGADAGPSVDAPVSVGPGSAGSVPTPDVPAGPAAIGGLALLVVALVVGVLVAYALASAVAEFVLTVAVRDGRVRLHGPAREQLGRGARLFAFRLALWAVAALVVGVPALLVLGGVVGLSPALVVLAVPLVLLAVVVGLVGWAVGTLTTDFAVPTMLAGVGARGPVAAWRHLWPTLRAEPVEVGIYLLVRVVLGLAAAAATGLVAGLAAVVVAVPFGVVGIGLFALLQPTLGMVGVALLALVALAFLAVVLVVWLVVQVPVVVFLRAFALAALGRFDARVDLLGVSETTAENGEHGEAGSTDEPGES